VAKKLIYFLFSLVLSVSFLACNQDNSKATPIKKGIGGSGPSLQKPDKAAVQGALNDSVLVQLNSAVTSQISAVSATGVVFKGALLINGKTAVGPWVTPFQLKIGDSSNSISLPQGFDLGDETLSLSVTAKRVQKNAADNKDMGYLTLKYQLDRAVEGVTKTSYLLLLLDLNAGSKSALKYKTEVIYPVPTGFDWDAWITKQKNSN
jgi:hypothetical protein